MVLLFFFFSHNAALLSSLVARYGARGARRAGDDAAQGQAGKGAGPELGRRRGKPQQASRFTFKTFSTRQSAGRENVLKVICCISYKGASAPRPGLSKCRGQ